MASGKYDNLLAKYEAGLAVANATLLTNVVSLGIVEIHAH